MAAQATVSVELEDCPCAFCGTPGGRVLFTARDRAHDGPGTFGVVRCETCGLMRTNPRPTPRSIGVYYPASYGPYLATAIDTPPPLKRLLNPLSDSLDTAIPPVTPGRLLEIGAASGSFLVKMQRLGWAVTGIELDKESAARAVARTGARVFQQDLASVRFDPGERFDLICSWMVVEHLHDPVDGLKRCREWLRPGGWLAFSVPNCGGWQFPVFRGDWFSLELPRHLYHFTAPQLRKIVSACGFEDVTLQWQRTLYDVPMSLAYASQSLLGDGIGQPLRRAADSLPVRVLARGAGIVAGPLHLSGRLTVWARRPETDGSD